MIRGRGNVRGNVRAQNMEYNISGRVNVREHVMAQSMEVSRV